MHRYINWIIAVAIKFPKRPSAEKIFENLSQDIKSINRSQRKINLYK